MSNLIYKIGITQIENVGDVNAKKLIAYCGGVEAVFKEKKTALMKIPGIGSLVAQSIVNQNVIDRAKKEVEFINKYNIQTYFYLDDNYPFRLKHCEDSPIIMYSKGNMNLSQEKIISIVGTRNVTQYGKDFCNSFVESLAPLNPLVISGLAYGVDINAHRAAYKNGMQTVAALAHGLDRVYPAMHKKDVTQMMNNGGILTDFISGTNPDRQNFPRRNRIVAGIADVTIVIESAKKGGSLITADIANSYARDVFAVPGRTGDQFSEGCNKLIKANKAHLLESVKDLEYIMGWSIKERPKAIQKQIFVDLNPIEAQLVDLLKAGKLNVDQIGLQAKIPVSKVSSILLNLEFSGVVKSLPGKVYELN